MTNHAKKLAFIIALTISAISAPSLAAVVTSNFRGVTEVATSETSNRFYFFLDGGNNGCAPNGNRYWTSLSTEAGRELASIVKAAFLSGRTVNVGYDDEVECSVNSRRVVYLHAR